jgi:hypothetical protein
MIPLVLFFMLETAVNKLNCLKWIKTELPPKKELEEKVKSLILEARERIESRKLLEQK